MVMQFRSRKEMALWMVYWQTDTDALWYAIDTLSTSIYMLYTLSLTICYRYAIDIDIYTIYAIAYDTLSISIYMLYTLSLTISIYMLYTLSLTIRYRYAIDIDIYAIAYDMLLISICHWYRYIRYRLRYAIDTYQYDCSSARTCKRQYTARPACFRAPVDLWEPTILLLTPYITVSTSCILSILQANVTLVV